MTLISYGRTLKRRQILLGFKQALHTMTDITHKFALALHGGAGAQSGRSYARAEAHLQNLAEEGERMLAAGASAVDVVEKMVREMEASGLYVAGRGSAANSAGYVELDAAIMDGTGRNAGAVAAIRDVKHPISAARALMEKTPYVMLAGDGATKFAAKHELETVENPEEYYTLPDGTTAEDTQTETLAHGTVGAVALDKDGRLAAATSTGGVFGKPEGRLGDTPINGIGNWADSEVAISCTGVGEYFILSGGASTVANGVKLAGDSLEDAVWRLLDDVKSLNGDGGVIAINKDGEIVMAYNSDGMKRASVSTEKPVSATTFAPCR